MLDPEVQDETITVQVAEGQFNAMMSEMTDPDGVHHKVAVGPYYLPGVWKVVSGRGADGGHREVTLHKVVPQEIVR